jgi:hypothetical protein
MSGVRSEGDLRPAQVIMSRAEEVRRKVMGKWTVAGWTGWLDVC